MPKYVEKISLNPGDKVQYYRPNCNQCLICEVVKVIKKNRHLAAADLREFLKILPGSSSFIKHYSHKPEERVLIKTKDDFYFFVSSFKYYYSSSEVAAPKIPNIIPMLNSLHFILSED